MGPNRRMLIWLVEALLVSSAASVLVPAEGADEGPSGGRGVILIHNVYELQNMSLDLNGSYELANDILANEWDHELGFVPIGDGNGAFFDYRLQREVYPHSFNGRFDGKGHTISHLSISRPKDDRVGLFACVNASAVIGNLTLSGFQVTGKNMVGGLVGVNAGSIINCHCAGTVLTFISGQGLLGGLVAVNHGTVSGCTLTGEISFRGSGSGGGLVGYNDQWGGTIDNCTIQGSITGEANVGGLAMNSSGHISDCHLIGSVSGKKMVGGLVADAHGIIVNCSSSGSVSGSDWVGGIAGSSGNIVGCYNTATVTGTGEKVGGIVGDNWKGKISGCFNSGAVKGNRMVGGLIGANYGNISKCYNTGPVCGTDEVGGLVGENSNDYGWMGDIYDCSSTGQVTGNERVGGLVGYHFFSSRSSGGWGAVISKCYSAGLVEDANGTGGFAGRSESSIADCYWDNQTSGCQTGSNGTGRNTSDMMKKATFAGWDFDDIWRIDEGVTYPYLRDMPVVTENRAPSILVDPPKSAATDHLYSVQFKAFDQDGDQLAWSMATDAGWLSMSGSGLLSGTPSGNDMGSYLVNVTVSDHHVRTDRLRMAPLAGLVCRPVRPDPLRGRQLHIRREGD